MLRRYPFDLVLLDLASRDMEATLLISRMRKAGHRTPVVALTSASGEGNG